ncbi:uncharacterized protein LOC126892914 [Diabrotica virgifera virgifera]|uniref:Uncharacterized protein n=1 Tax=Diabrotica virgifera virgifera TaxID=50390 RepID=A0ABM5L8K8_DIAVI|nr:uncharacterized protein LOC126892914 [Diabrotica virgifera virgifera]
MDFKGVPPMEMSGNVSEKFWKQRFTTYLVATEISKKAQETQCALLLTLIGDEGMRIYNTFTFLDEEKNKLEVLLTKYDNHFTPKKNLTYERHQILTSKQTEFESIEQFSVRVKNISLNCELDQLRESLVKDILICGIKSNEIREKLLQGDLKTLEEVIKKAVIIEKTKERNMAISSYMEAGKSDLNVDKVNKKPSRDVRGEFRQKLVTQHQSNNNRECKKCSYKHDFRKCPAYGKVCARCGGYNHFSSACYNKKNNRDRRSVYAVGDNSEREVKTVYVEAIDMISKNGEMTWAQELNIGAVRPYSFVSKTTKRHAS